MFLAMCAQLCRLCLGLHAQLKSIALNFCFEHSLCVCIVTSEPYLGAPDLLLTFNALNAKLSLELRMSIAIDGPPVGLLMTTAIERPQQLNDLRSACWWLQQLNDLRSAC